MRQMSYAWHSTKQRTLQVSVTVLCTSALSSVKHRQVEEPDWRELSCGNGHRILMNRKKHYRAEWQWETL